MKKISTILLFTLLVFLAAKAQVQMKKDSLLLENDETRSDIFAKRLDIYKSIPTNLWQWSYGNISNISFNEFYSSGDFKTVDQFSTENGLGFKSESVQTMAEKGWVFYGKFAFNSSTHKKTNYNVFYTKSKVGSPFRVVTKRTGDFRVKHYGLAGGMSKKLNDKISVGAQIDYAGDLYFRVRDTRNEQYNLTIDFTTAVSYNFTAHSSLSLGLAYYYHKTTNTYSNDFKTSGPEYFLYNLNGLGDFNQAEIDDHIIITDQNPKILLSYFSGEKNKFSLHYSLYPGNDEWNNKIVSLNSETPEKLYKYEYLNNNITGSYLVSKTNYEFFNKVNANVILGDGYEYRGTSYQPTYLYEGITAAYTSDLYRHNKHIFYKNLLGFSFENIRKKDMTYAHEMKYTNVSANIKTGYFLAVNSKNKLTIDLGLSYKMNLDYLHEVVAAASKPYTINIAYNEMAYNTADVLQFGTEGTWYGTIGKLKTEYKLQYNYTTPLKIRILNNYSQLETNTYKNNISASINFYF